MNYRNVVYRFVLALLVSLVLPLSCQSQVIALPGVAKKAEEKGPGHRIFVIDRDAVKLFKYAKKRIENKDYQAGLAALQRILELSEDSNFYLDADKAKTVCRSLKGEALRYIAELPAEGREQYQLKYGTEAKQLLAKARQSGDVKQMESLARKYFNTPSGYTATWWLGNRHFDRSEPLAAALFYERLRKNSKSSKQFEPMLTLKTAICWGRAGMPELAVEKLIELKKATPQGGRLTIGGDSVALFDQEDQALDWMVKLLGQQQGFTQLKEEEWTLFRGNSSRNAISSPAAPVWDAQWKVSTFQEQRLVGDEKERFNTAEKKMQIEGKKRREKDGLLGIGASHPLVVGDYVIYRSLRKIRAVNLYTGKLFWETATSSYAVEQIIRMNEIKPNKNTRYSYYNRQMKPLDDSLLDQCTWRDMTLGTLSSDGNYLFAVDGGGVVNAFANYPGMPENPLGPKKYNKLRSFNISTGKYTWEIGGPRGEAELSAAGLFFLGAPLPFGNLLFCIVERDGEIQLVGIEPDPDEYDAQVVWSQPLITPAKTIKDDTIRRLSGLTPSYRDGVMICPTSAGAVVAVDLSQRLLLWGYRYNTRAPSTPTRRGFGWNPYRNSGADLLDQRSRWLDSAPTIVDGKVLLTPRDSNQLHCLNLLDGAVQWTIDREEGFYLAGVHEGKVVIVGKTAINAYRLDNGKPAWKEPVPIPKPNGRGYQTEGLYHFPLVTGSIATIDLNTGHILVQSKSRNGTIPGNLVASRGIIISQSATEISAYRALNDINNEVNKKLIANSNDSSALAMRGELKLHHGDAVQGMKDLRSSIKTESNHRAQTILAEAILDGMQSDFLKYQARSAELEKLIVDPQQKSRFLRVYADGLWKSGDQLGAVKKYIEFAGPSTGKLELQQIDGSTAIRNDRWLRSRLNKIFTNASPQEQLVLVQLIKKQYDASRTEADPVSLRKFTQCFNGMPIASQAQTELAEKLDHVKDGLERGLLLLNLSHSQEKEKAGYATAKLAELSIQQSHQSHLVQLLHRLETDFADVVCLNKKNGKELATAWKKEKAVFSLLADQQIFPTEYKVTSENERSRSYNYNYTVPIEGDTTGLFTHKSLKATDSGRSLEAKDEQGKVLWKIQIAPRTGNVAIYPQVYSARLLGNLLLFNAGGRFLVIDTKATSSAKRLLWKGNLIENFDSKQPGRLSLRQQIVGGVKRWTATDRQGQRIGQVGPVTTDAIIYQQGNKIIAADPLTGDILWKRSGFDPGCEMKGNQENIIVISPRNQKEAIVLSAIDGERIRKQALPAGTRLYSDGMKVIVSEKLGKNLVLKCYQLDQFDPTRPQQKTVWEKKFSQTTQFQIVSINKIAAIDTKGHFEIIAMKDGKSIIQDEVQILKSLSRLIVFTSVNHYVLMMSPPNVFVRQGMRIMANNSNVDVLVDGTIYGYNRKTGKREWESTIEKNAINPLQQQNTPFIIFSARRYERIMKKVGKRNVQSSRSSYLFSVLDSRTGKMLSHKVHKSSVYPFSVKIDSKTKQVEIALRTEKIKLTPVAASD